MKIAVLKEIAEGETRVALVPSAASKLIEMGYEVEVQSGAGLAAGFEDERYVIAGAKIVKDAASAYKNAKIVVKIWAPLEQEDKFLSKDMIIIANFKALYMPERIENFKRIGVKCFALDLMPRISRAQNVDILSSQNNLAGYAAIIKAAEISKKVFPMMMTSAGTIPPARVLVLGVGVAGLQAIATAKRLGAMVFASDIREDTREQVQSLGAKFVETSDVSEVLKKTNILITTANVQGEKAPILVEKKDLGNLPYGAVVIDMASEKGGNVEGSVEGKTIEGNGITIVGNSNLAAEIPHCASYLYSNNMLNFIDLIKDKIDLSDEIIRETFLSEDKQALVSDEEEK